jgi:hypothetical protein
VLAGNTDPHGACTATNPPCGFDGTCDGTGACRKGAVGTSCGTASCTGSTAKPVGACDGAGNCAQSTTSCNAYVCGANACLTTCASPADCASGYTCQSGSCVNLKALGASCASGSECLSTFCTDGVCCSSGPCGSCLSCAVSGKAGTCQPVGTILDPAHVCTDQTAATCGTNGLCDGAGHCATYPVGTACAAATCQASAPILNAAATCDTAHHCTPATTTSCSPYACASAACNTGCSVSTDCATGYACVANPDGGPGTCVPAG